MGDKKYWVGIRKDVYDFLTKFWYKHDKQRRIELLLVCWNNKNNDFKKELMSNLSPDDAVSIIDYILDHR